MSKIERFEDMEIWQMGVKVTLAIYRLTESFPKTEMYGLTSQMRRASVSIPSNIAEGFKRRSRKEFAQFLAIAQGSIGELSTQVTISRELGLVAPEANQDLQEQLDHLGRMTTLFQQRLTTARPHDRTTARFDRTTARRGMTFLELMVAMVILGLLMAIVLPRMVGSTNRTHLRGAAREFIALMRYARSTAVFGEIEVELRMSPREGIYRLAYDPAAITANRLQDGRERRDRSERRGEEAAIERAAQWMRIRSFPTDRMEIPTVRFAAVETELELETERGRDSVPGIVFYPDGTASGGLIVLEGKDGGHLSIEVLTATGLAEISDGDARDQPADEEAGAS